MTKENCIRVFFILAAFSALIWTVLGYLNPPSENAYNPQKAFQNYETPNKVYAPPPNIDLRNKSTLKTTDKEIEDWKSKRSDLAAQWETADMAHLAFRMGVIGIILLTWTLIETRSASKSAAQALLVAKTEQRPWITITARLKNIAPLKESGKLVVRCTLEMTLKNIGKTPANNIKFTAKPITCEGNLNTFKQNYKNLIRDDNSLGDQAMLPGDEVTQKIYLTYTQDTFSKASVQGVSKACPYFIIRVNYGVGGLVKKTAIGGVFKNPHAKVHIQTNFEDIVLNDIKFTLINRVKFVS